MTVRDLVRLLLLQSVDAEATVDGGEPVVLTEDGRVNIVGSPYEPVDPPRRRPGTRPS